MVVWFRDRGGRNVTPGQAVWVCGFTRSTERAETPCSHRERYLHWFAVVGGCVWWERSVIVGPSGKRPRSRSIRALLRRHRGRCSAATLLRRHDAGRPGVGQYTGRLHARFEWRSLCGAERPAQSALERVPQGARFPPRVAEDHPCEKWSASSSTRPTRRSSLPRIRLPSRVPSHRVTDIPALEASREPVRAATVRALSETISRLLQLQGSRVPVSVAKWSRVGITCETVIGGATGFRRSGVDLVRLGVELAVL